MFVFPAEARGQEQRAGESVPQTGVPGVRGTGREGEGKLGGGGSHVGECRRSHGDQSRSDKQIDSRAVREGHIAAGRAVAAEQTDGWALGRAVTPACATGEKLNLTGYMVVGAVGLQVPLCSVKNKLSSTARVCLSPLAFVPRVSSAHARRRSHPTAKHRAQTSADTPHTRPFE